MVAIDTCSLVQLVRYYLPFDKNLMLYNFIKSKIENKSIIVIDRVFDECILLSQGIVAKHLPYLKDHKLSTTNILPDRKFFNLTEHNFINATQKNLLTPEQFEVKKNEWLDRADAKLILLGLSKKDLLTSPTIITEESELNNDNKEFKKIPTLCKITELNVISLPSFLLEQGIEINFNFGSSKK